MSFDVPKLVRSPGCDHGYDEESRNGRDIKIDILEGYVCVTPSMRLYLPRVEARLRGITALKAMSQVRQSLQHPMYNIIKRGDT